MRTVSVKPVPSPVETIAAAILKHAGDDPRWLHAVALGMIEAHAGPDPHGWVSTLTDAQRLDCIRDILAAVEIARTATPR